MQDDEALERFEREQRGYRPLPSDLVARGLKLASGARFMGRCLGDLTRDELIAVAAIGWDAERDARAPRNR